MTTYINELASDVVTLDSRQLSAKYKGNIKSGITITETVDALEKCGLIDRLVRNDWKNDGGDKDGLYLIRAGDHFEVFAGERGIKNWKQEFPDIKSACFAWVDFLFNEFYYLAPDTNIK